MTDDDEPPKPVVSLAHWRSENVDRDFGKERLDLIKMLQDTGLATVAEAAADEWMLLDWCLFEAKLLLDFTDGPQATSADIIRLAELLRAGIERRTGEKK